MYSGVLKGVQVDRDDASLALQEAKASPVQPDKARNDLQATRQGGLYTNSYMACLAADWLGSSHAWAYCGILDKLRASNYGTGGQSQLQALYMAGTLGTEASRSHQHVCLLHMVLAAGGC
jgi:hypothetical protein